MPDLFLRVGTRGRGTIPGAGITGTSGVWTDVTNGSWDMLATDNSNDQAGVQDILADPITAGVFYAFICYNGCWRSTDYGLTWTKRSTAGGPLDFGKPWGEDIAPDGSYMLATDGNSLEGSPNGQNVVLKSTDGGISWSRSADTGHQPYQISICPSDQTQVLSSMHDNAMVYGSTDSGATWSLAIDTATGGTGGYVQYLQDANHAIYVGQDSTPVYLLTKSGTWSKSAIATLALAGHGHGAYQGYRDPSTGRYYHPASSNTGGDGIWTTDDNAATFTNRYSTSGESCIAATPTTLYAMRSFPLGNTSYDPKITTSLRSSGTSWAAPSSPGMTNGGKNMAVGTDGTRYVILAGCWNAGLWRYVE